MSTTKRTQIQFTPAQKKRRTTKGPWRVIPAHGPYGRIVIHDEGADLHSEVAKVYGHTPDCAEGNARLIAAAPELLEALKLARKCIAYCRKAHKDIQSGDGIPVEKFLDAAIAKAEGGAA